MNRLPGELTAEFGARLSVNTRQPGHKSLRLDRGRVVRTFDPWIGRHYHAGIRGVRLLILGEAHYGSAGAENRAFTAEIIRRLAIKDGYRFFTIAQHLVCGGRGRLPVEDRDWFWERVAFYNFVQSFPGKNARRRPTTEMWADAKEPFIQTIRELMPQPHLLLVLGRELHRHLPALQSDLRVCAVQHPSSRGFRYDEAQPVVRAAFDSAAVSQSKSVMPNSGH